MTFEAYVSSDRANCLAIFDSNTPTFFLASERDEFASFLDFPRGHYLVVRKNDHIIGCGGIAPGHDAVLLCWGMIHREFHRHGLGRALLEERLRVARQRYAHLQRVRIETSQHSAPFFERAGFFVETTAINGFGEGMDRVTMSLSLSPVTVR